MRTLKLTSEARWDGVVVGDKLTLSSEYDLQVVPEPPALVLVPSRSLAWDSTVWPIDAEPGDRLRTLERQCSSEAGKYVSQEGGLTCVTG